MQATRRPLPTIPPPQLTFVHPADSRSYRPLPTPPLQSSDSGYTSSTESVYLQTPPIYTTPLGGALPSSYIAHGSSSSLSSFSSTSSELLSKPRPRLRISVTSSTVRKRNSLDSLTVRSPALCDPGQTLSPVVGRRHNAVTFDPRWSKHAPYISNRCSRVSAADSVISPLVFRGPVVITEPDILEPEEDGKSALTHTLSVPPFDPLNQILPHSPTSHDRRTVSPTVMILRNRPDHDHY